MTRYYLVMVEETAKGCSALSDDEIIDRAVWCDPRATCNADKHETRVVTYWSPHCTGGKVVALYDSVGKARAQVTRYATAAGYYARGVTKVSRVHYFDVEDLFELDDPTPELQQLEARMLRYAERADKQQAAERAAVDMMGSAVQGKRTRKKKKT